MDTMDEFIIVGKKLYQLNPEATLWNLLVVMYEYKTGCKFPELPDEDDVLYCYFNGLSARSIAKRLNTDAETVITILKSIGFTPHRNDLPCTVEQIFDLLQGLSVKETAKATKVSTKIIERILDEFEAWIEQESGEDA